MLIVIVAHHIECIHEITKRHDFDHETPQPDALSSVKFMLKFKQLQT
jgi:hypothetical protein